MNAETEKEWMTLDETAKYLGVHRYTVMQFCRQKKIVHGKIGRRYRFKKKDLDSFIMRSGNAVARN